MGEFILHSKREQMVPSIPTGKINDLGNRANSAVYNSFETVLRNLKSLPSTISYVGNKISTIVYTTDTGTITETINYTTDVVTSITLSGGTQDGISLTKTFNYTGTNITSLSYS